MAEFGTLGWTMEFPTERILFIEMLVHLKSIFFCLLLFLKDGKIYYSLILVFCSWKIGGMNHHKGRHCCFSRGWCCTCLQIPLRNHFCKKTFQVELILPQRECWMSSMKFSCQAAFAQMNHEFHALSSLSVPSLNAVAYWWLQLRDTTMDLKCYLLNAAILQWFQPRDGIIADGHDHSQQSLENRVLSIFLAGLTQKNLHL